MADKPKPADFGGRRLEFWASDWKPYSKKSLLGFLSLNLPSGLIFFHCRLHQKGGARWIGLPTQQYKKSDGSICYIRLIEFSSEEKARLFQEAALRAVDRLIGEAK
jgi:hypothetical protein